MESTRADGWGNILTGLGIAERDKRLYSEVQTPERLTRTQLEDLYSGDGLARRICDLPAREQTRQWISLATDEEDTAKLVMQALETLGVQTAVTTAMTWARLHGGAVVLMGLDDGQDPEQPLDEARVKSFGWLTVLDRWELDVARTYADPFAPKYGEPEIYRVSSMMAGAGVNRFGALVHESRVLRFDGVLTPRLRREANAGWCDSVFTALLAVLRDTWGGLDGAAHLLQDFSQGVLKVKGLAGLVGANDDVVLRRLQILDMVRSMVRAVVVDADGESFERITTSVAGLPEMLDRFMSLLSAVTGIPVTLLFGRSPAGLNATGDSDIRFFYDCIRTEQQTGLRPKLERLLTLLLRAADGPTAGQEPDEWSFEFNPLWQLTEKEHVELHKVQAETDAIYIGQQVLHPDEVRQSRFSGDRYSIETTLDPELEGISDVSMPGDEPEVPPPPPPGVLPTEQPAEDDAGARTQPETKE